MVEVFLVGITGEPAVRDPAVGIGPRTLAERQIRTEERLTPTQKVKSSSCAGESTWRAGLSLGESRTKGALARSITHLLPATSKGLASGGNEKSRSASGFIRSG